MRTDSSALNKRPAAIAGVPRVFLHAMWVVAGFMIFTAWNQSHWWISRDDYAFGWLVPVFVGYIVYDRWPQTVSALRIRCGLRASACSRAVRSGAWLALTGGVCFYLFGALTLASAGASYPASLALSLGTAGVTWGLATLTAYSEGADGWAVGKLFVFPALVWLVSAPMVSLVENTVSVFLLGKVTSAVFFVFESLGLAIEQRGNVLVLPTGEVGIAQACSGIRSLMGCVFAGAFLGAICFDRLWKKTALLLAASVFAFSMNLARSLFLTGWAYAYGPDAIEGRLHDWTGLAVVAVASAGLLGLAQVLNWKIQFRSSA